MASINSLTDEINIESKRPPSPKLARLFLVRARMQLKDENLSYAQEDCIRAMGVSELLKDDSQLREARRLFDSMRGAADIHFFLPHFKSIMDEIPRLSRREGLSRLKALCFCLHHYQQLADLLHPTIMALLSNLQDQVERQVRDRVKPRRRWINLFRRKKGYQMIDNELGPIAEFKLSRFQKMVFQDYGGRRYEDFEEPEEVLTL